MKRICVLLVGILMFSLISGCGQVSDKRINLVTSFYPIYIMVLNLVDGVDGVSVTNMAENHTGCLHDFQLQTSDMKKIENADAFIINGVGMESFLDKILNTGAQMTIIDSSKGIEALEDEHHGHNHEHEENEENGEKHVNSHIWVSVSNYIKQVDNICEGLVSVDPQNESKYRGNATKYKEKLEALKQQMHHELDGLRHKDVVTFHEAFPYFAKEFGINVAAVISSEPENEPSVKELSEVVEIVREYGITALFVEPQYPDNSAKVISQETGARIYVLDSGSSGEISKDAYLNTMKANLEVLKEALA